MGLDNAKLSLLALCSIPSLGPVLQRRLINAFGSADAVFNAKESDIASIAGIGARRAGDIKLYKCFDELSKRVENAMSSGARILTYNDPEYPQGIGNLGEYAPLVLFAKGGFIEEDKYAVSIVGTRTPTQYGLNVSYRLSEQLSKMGFTVVSGAARGIDTAAHNGALKAGGRSIAVLGCGIDISYPAENRGLLDALGSHGAVVTEFPPSTPPYRENFPRRNRLISALSLGVVVVEAAQKSGALITAQFALEQGKEVFSVPGSINSPASEGPNALIKDGAKAVTSAQDILSELSPLLKGFIKKDLQKDMPALSDEEKNLCKIMGKEPMHIDEMARAAGYSANRISSVLLALELNGIVRQLEGKHFQLV